MPLHCFIVVLCSRRPLSVDDYYVGFHPAKLWHGLADRRPDIGRVAHEETPSPDGQAVAIDLFVKCHGRGYVVGVVKQHYIEPEEAADEVGIEYGTVLAV